MYSSAYSVLFLVLLSVLVSTCSSQQHTTAFQKINSTRPSPSSPVTAKAARSDYPHHGAYDHHYPHHYGGHLGYGGHGHKDFEHYLLPMLLILGLGVLCMPLLSVFMGTLVGNVPVTTLVSGRRKRQAPGLIEEKTLMDLWKKVGKAIEVFTKKD